MIVISTEVLNQMFVLYSSYCSYSMNIRTYINTEFSPSITKSSVYASVVPFDPAFPL